MCAFALAACNQQEAPSKSAATTPAAAPAPAPEPPKPAAPAVNEELKRLAAEVYVFAYPLVVTDVTREVQAAKVGMNEFRHDRAVPNASTTDVAFPNADFLYSQAWLDLSKGPIVLSVPDTKGRYYLVAMLDAWTNVATSIGKRTTGTEKGDFAIVGPRWKGSVPAGMSEVKSSTEMAWLFGRMRLNDRNEIAAVTKLEDQFKLRPLAGAPRKGKEKEPPPVHAGAVDTKTPPRDQVANMDAATFYTRVALLLPGNPPSKDDAAMQDKIKRLGIVPGQPFDTKKLSPLDATSVEQGLKSAIEAIVTAGRRSAMGDIRNGWSTDRDLGRWGTDYGKRAVAAWRGIGVNAPEDAIFMTAHFDAGGKRLDGNNRYVLHFDKDSTPPTDGFWSLSMYNELQRFAPNALNRFNIDSGDELKTNPDGSLDLYIQSADPGQDKQTNWLPAPKGPFTVMLRVYWPKDAVVSGKWNPPGIKQVSG